MLAQSSAYPIVLGAGSIGPFAVPIGSPGALLAMDRTGLPAGAPLLTAAWTASFDGGQTFEQMVAVEIPGGIITRNGATVLQTTVEIQWPKQPTHFRIDVDSVAAFNAAFTITAL